MQQKKKQSGHQPQAGGGKDGGQSNNAAKQRRMVSKKRPKQAERHCLARRTGTLGPTGRGVGHERRDAHPGRSRRPTHPQTMKTRSALRDGKRTASHARDRHGRPQAPWRPRRTAGRWPPARTPPPNDNKQTQRGPTVALRGQGQHAVHALAHGRQGTHIPVRSPTQPLTPSPQRSENISGEEPSSRGDGPNVPQTGGGQPHLRQAQTRT